MGVTKKDIRQEIKKYLNTANDKTVLMIHAMLEAELKADAITDELFDREIDKRFAEYKRGKAKVISLNDLEAGARAAYHTNI